MSFRRAVTKTPVAKTRTTNGMATLTSSGHPVLDFFSTSGAMRPWSDDQKIASFKAAFNHDPLLALKALFYMRDARKGQGERQAFRTILKWLAEQFPEQVAVNLPLVPKYGRWDDLMATEGSDVEVQAAGLWMDAILAKDRLAAKWAPRKGSWFGILRNRADEDPRTWRKRLVAATDVVESKMCRKMFDTIDYKSVPSRAHMIYRKAFGRQDKARYAQFLEAAKKGLVKINASVLYPHEFVAKLDRWGVKDATLELQWKALPDFVTNGRGFMPICDVSGSMSGQPMNVSVGLGIYLAQRNRSAFKNLICTFSESPSFVDITPCGSLSQTIWMVKSMPWGMNTNLEKVFTTMLQLAKREKVAPEDMPESLLIISDMQFDQCVMANQTAMKMIREKYEAAGYQMPGIVFWNVNAHKGQSPVQQHESGAALVSGFSPSIMTAVLARKPEATPLELMLDKLNEYDDVRVAE